MSFIVKNFSLWSTNLAIAVKVLSILTCQWISLEITVIFDFYFINTEITPTVLDRGDEIILAIWPNDKHIICNINNDIPVKIPSHPYVLVNRSILCNCGIEADNYHLLESIASCDKKITKLTMYFTINLAFTNYLDIFPNLDRLINLN